MKKRTKAAAAPAKPKRAKTNRVRMSEELMLDVRHNFSDSEKIELGTKLTQTITTRDQLEDQKKITVKDFDSKIKVFEGEISTLHSKLRDGYEFRPTAVIVHYNKDTDPKTGKARKKPGTKRIVVKESGAHVRDEPMTATDLQAEMFTKEQLKRQAAEAAKNSDKKPGEEKPLNAPAIPEKSGEAASTAATA